MSAVRKGVTVLAIVAAGVAVALVAAPWWPAPKSVSLFATPVKAAQEQLARELESGGRPVRSAIPAHATAANQPRQHVGDAGCPTPCPNCAPGLAGRAGP